MTRLAEKPGLSGWGLAQVCERNRVARSGQGYWQKKQHGQSVEPTPFREVEDEERLSTVRFSRGTNPSVEKEEDGNSIQHGIEL